MAESSSSSLSPSAHRSNAAISHTESSVDRSSFAARSRSASPIVVAAGGEEVGCEKATVLMDLPSSVMGHVFKYLDAHDVNSLRRCCKGMDAAVKSHGKSKLIITIAADFVRIVQSTLGVFLKVAEGDHAKSMSTFANGVSIKRSGGNYDVNIYHGSNTFLFEGISRRHPAFPLIDRVVDNADNLGWRETVDVVKDIFTKFVYNDPRKKLPDFPFSQDSLIKMMVMMIRCCNAISDAKTAGLLADELYNIDRSRCEHLSKLIYLTDLSNLAKLGSYSEAIDYIYSNDEGIVFDEFQESIVYTGSVLGEYGHSKALEKVVSFILDERQLLYPGETVQEDVLFLLLGSLARSFVKKNEVDKLKLASCKYCEGDLSYSPSVKFVFAEAFGLIGDTQKASDLFDEALLLLDPQPFDAGHDAGTYAFRAAKGMAVGLANKMAMQDADRWVQWIEHKDEDAGEDAKIDVIIELGKQKNMDLAKQRIATLRPEEKVGCYQRFAAALAENGDIGGLNDVSVDAVRHIGAASAQAKVGENLDNMWVGVCIGLIKSKNIKEAFQHYYKMSEQGQIAEKSLHVLSTLVDNNYYIEAESLINELLLKTYVPELLRHNYIDQAMQSLAKLKAKIKLCN